ncbi:MAG: Phytoene desaturase (lycopene-forming) [Anaerolineales bacterium]|nr:Phytoene desaturase (lycopene-forming) [Anaerolineales bacterium]
MTHHDAILIGAGHNSLVAAAYLAKAGKKVIVLERRDLPGGTLAGEDFEDTAFDPVWPGGQLRPDIVKDLKLTPPRAAERTSFTSLLGQNDSLTLAPDSSKAGEAIARFSQRDAARWPEFVRFIETCARILDTAYHTRMPRLPKHFNLAEGYGLLELGLELRLAGRKDMLHFIRALPMTVQELLDEYFESDALKGALASLAIHGQTLGPWSAGTGYTFIHNWLNRGGLSHPQTQAGDLAATLAAAAKKFGAEIRTGSEVTRILVDNYACKGVILASGEELHARAVLSGVDPKRTLLGLVGAASLPPEFIWKVQSIKMRGSVAKIHLFTDGSHGLPHGTLVVAPTTKYLEQAYDAAKYGEISARPYLEATTCGRVVSIHFQSAPYDLKDATWNLKRGALEALAINALAEHAPNLKSSIKKQKSITPLDLESIYGLTEGDLNHGQLLLDQFLFMRPMPGWSNHKTPIDHLYLCGSGVHGGGGVSGAAGRNAAQVAKANAL